MNEIQRQTNAAKRIEYNKKRGYKSISARFLFTQDIPACLSKFFQSPQSPFYGYRRAFFGYVFIRLDHFARFRSAVSGFDDDLIPDVRTELIAQIKPDFAFGFRFYFYNGVRFVAVQHAAAQRMYHNIYSYRFLSGENRPALYYIIRKGILYNKKRENYIIRKGKTASAQTFAVLP